MVGPRTSWENEPKDVDRKERHARIICLDIFDRTGNSVVQRPLALQYWYRSNVMTFRDVNARICFVSLSLRNSAEHAEHGIYTSYKVFAHAPGCVTLSRFAESNVLLCSKLPTSFESLAVRR
jgi:hypothetical protein